MVSTRWDDGLDMTFCRQDAVDCAELFRLLNCVIDLSPNEFDRVYDQFRGSFRQESGTPEEAFEHDFVRKRLSLVNSVLRWVGRAVVEWPGIDLPCWIEVAKDAPLIILVGQDSLRDDSYFRVPAADGPYVVIGTPYTVHSRALWHYKNNRRYWAVIGYLLRKGYNVYLTDVFKFWCKDVARGEEHEGIYARVLRQEFHVVGASGPGTYVVVFGGVAAAFLGRTFSLRDGWDGKTISDTRAEIIFDRGIRALRVMHPSPENERRLRDYLLHNGIDPDRDVDPKWRVEGIGMVIDKTIGIGREPETTAPTLPPTPAPADPTPHTERKPRAWTVGARCAESGMGVGDRVEFIGRVVANKGKLGVITGQKDAGGFKVTFADGTKGTATPGGLRLIRRATSVQEGLQPTSRSAERDRPSASPSYSSRAAVSSSRLATTDSKPGRTRKSTVGPQDKYALVESHIKRRHPRWSVTKAPGGTLLVANPTTGKSMSLKVRFGQDTLPRHPRSLGKQLMAMGFWSVQKQALQTSDADLWVFEIPSSSDDRISFVIIPPGDLRRRLERIRGTVYDTGDKYWIYFWITKTGRCWEARNLPIEDEYRIADDSFSDDARDFRDYLNAWHVIEEELA